MEVPLAEAPVNEDKLKNRLSKESIPYMDTVSCFANRRHSVGVERGCLFLCGQTICWSHMHVAIIQKRPMIGYKATYQPIQCLNWSALMEITALFHVFFFLHLHKMMPNRSLMVDTLNIGEYFKNNIL